MENQTPSKPGADIDNLFGISFDAISIDHLKRLSLWAKITSVCAFISYLFTLVAAFFGHATASALTDDNTAATTTLTKTSNVIGAMLVVIIGGAINFFLYQFAVAVGKGARGMDPLKVNSGFDSLRIYFKIIGILLIIALAIIVLAIVVALVAGGTLVPNQR
ncbi:MAG TPA: hypothetical protein VGR89_13115 [Puia sp.]|nr:hypothetical protein [Puia sp.]